MLVVADDPGRTRQTGKIRICRFCQTSVMEPSSAQEAKDMTICI